MGEGQPQVTTTPELSLDIADNEDISRVFSRFEWKSFLNGGYIIRAVLNDPHWQLLTGINQDYLDKARREPTPMKWTIEWPGGGKKTTRRLAFLTKLSALGESLGGTTEFIGIDPPSFFLNAGNCDGSVFEGNVSDVIQQIVNRYAPSIKIKGNITETVDYNKNQFWMMRQDPKTFIMSLLDWSSSITGDKTNWIVASNDEELIIKEQAQFESEDFGIFNMNAGIGAEDILEFEFLGDNFLTTIQTKLLTQGISSVTEKYLDKESDPDEQFVFVKDENTSQKRNVKIGKDRGYRKPKDSLNFDDGESSSGGTSIMAVPEFNAGELGISYEDWIDGRPRNQFLRMLTLLNRLRIRVNGNAELDDSTKLGTSTCTLNWFDAEGKNFFLSGKWLIYGWHHVVEPGDWYTDIYLSRLDFDAAAKKV